MKLVDTTAKCTVTDCLDRTHPQNLALVRPCPVHHVAPFVRRSRQSPLARYRRRARVSDTFDLACYAHPAQQSNSDTSARAVELVHSLRQELDGLKRLQLSSACSLAMYRLTVLCGAQRQAEVASALALVSLQCHLHSIFLLT